MRERLETVTITVQERKNYCIFLKKNETFHVICIEFRSKCSGNYPSECSIFQNGIPCFRYNHIILIKKICILLWYFCLFIFKNPYEKNRSIKFCSVFDFYTEYVPCFVRRIYRTIFYPEFHILTL